MTDADLPPEQPLWHEAPRRGGPGGFNGGRGGGFQGQRPPPPGLLGDGAHRMLQHSLHMGRQQYPGAGVQPGYGMQQPQFGFQQGPPMLQQQPQFGFQQPQFGFQQGPPMQQQQPQFGFQQGPPMQQPQFGVQAPQFGFRPPQQAAGGAKFMGGSFGGPPSMQPPVGFGGFTPAPPGMQPGQFGGPPPLGFGQPGPGFGDGPYGQQPPPQQQQGGFAQGNRYAALQRRP